MAYNYSSSDDDIYADLDSFQPNLDASHPSYREDCCSVQTEIPSDPWLDDHDVLTVSGSEYWKNECASFFPLEESKLKEEELQLYNEILVVEAEEKKAEVEYKSGYESLQREVEKLQKSDAEKTAKLSQLTIENMNLKKNICSLYKTAKSEIEHKDFLLKQANRKLDRFASRRAYYINSRQEADPDVSSKEACNQDGKSLSFEKYQKNLEIRNTKGSSYHSPQHGSFPSRTRYQEHAVLESHKKDSNVQNINQNSVVPKKISLENKKHKLKKFRSVSNMLDNLDSGDDSSGSEAQNKVHKIESNGTNSRISGNAFLLKGSKLDSISKWIESTLNYNESTSNAYAESGVTDSQPIHPKTACLKIASTKKNEINEKQTSKPIADDCSAEKINEQCCVTTDKVAGLNDNDSVVLNVSPEKEQCNESLANQSYDAVHDTAEKMETECSSSGKNEDKNSLSVVKDNGQPNHVEHVVLNESGKNANFKVISHSATSVSEKNSISESNDDDASHTVPSVIENASQDVGINEKCNNSEKMIIDSERILPVVDHTRTSVLETKPKCESVAKKCENFGSNEMIKSDDKEFHQEDKMLKCADIDKENKSNSNVDETCDKHISTNVSEELGDDNMKRILDDSTSNGISEEKSECEIKCNRNEQGKKRSDRCVKESRAGPCSSGRERNKNSRDEKYSSNNIRVRDDCSPQARTSTKPRKKDHSRDKYSSCRNKERHYGDSNSSKDIGTYRRSKKDNKYHKTHSPYKSKRDNDKYSVDFLDRDRSRSSKTRELIAVRKRCFRNFRPTRTTDENRKSFPKDLHCSPKCNLERSCTNEHDVNKKSTIISSSIQSATFTNTNTCDVNSEIVDELSILSTEITSNGKIVIKKNVGGSKYVEYQENVLYDRKCNEIFNKIGKNISCDQINEPKLDFSGKIAKNVSKENCSSVAAVLCHMLDKTEHVLHLSCENNATNCNKTNCKKSDEKVNLAVVENRILSEGEICSSDEECDLPDKLFDAKQNNSNKSSSITDTKKAFTNPFSTTVFGKNRCYTDRNANIDKDYCDGKARKSSCSKSTRPNIVSEKNVCERKQNPNDNNFTDNNLKNNAITGDTSEKNHCKSKLMQIMNKACNDNENKKKSCNESKRIALMEKRDKKEMSKKNVVGNLEYEEQFRTSLKTKKLKESGTENKHLYEKDGFKSLVKSSVLEKNEKESFKQNKKLHEADKVAIPLKEKCDEKILSKKKETYNSKNVTTDTEYDKNEHMLDEINTPIVVKDNVLHLEEVPENKITPIETSNSEKLKQLVTDVHVLNRSKNEENLKTDCANKTLKKSDHLKTHIGSKDVNNTDETENMSTFLDNVNCISKEMNLNSNLVVISSSNQKLDEPKLNTKVVSKTSSTEIRDKQASEKVMNNVNSMSDQSSDAKKNKEINFSEEVQKDAQTCAEMAKNSFDSREQRNVSTEEKLHNSCTERHPCFSDSGKNNSKDRRDLSPSSHQYHTLKTMKECENISKEKRDLSPSSHQHHTSKIMKECENSSKERTDSSFSSYQHQTHKAMEAREDSSKESRGSSPSSHQHHTPKTIKEYKNCSKEIRDSSPISHLHHTPKTTKEPENNSQERVSSTVKSCSSKKNLDGADTPKRKDVTPTGRTRNEKKKDSRTLDHDFHEMKDVTPRSEVERRGHSSSRKRRCTPSPRRDQEVKKDCSSLRRRELSYKRHFVSERTKRSVAFDRDREKHLVSYRRVMASEEREIWTMREKRDKSRHKEDQDLSHTLIRHSYTRHSDRNPSNQNEQHPDLDMIHEENLGYSEGENALTHDNLERNRKKLKVEIGRHHVSPRNGGFMQLKNSIRSKNNELLRSSQHIVASTSGDPIKDLTATNTLFFNLLPDELKQAFQDYEQKQIISMNMLKQTFVNYYFNQCEHSGSLFGPSKSNPEVAKTSSLQNIPPIDNGQQIDLEDGAHQILPHVQQHSDVDSVDISVNRSVDFSSDDAENRFHQNDEPKTCGSAQADKIQNNVDESQVKVTEFMKDNVIKLYKYNHEKIPFLVKRKYGLLKSDS